MIFFTARWRRAFILTLAAAAFSLSLISSAVAAVTLNGSGATFPKPLYDRYFSQMRSANQITVKTIYLLPPRPRQLLLPPRKAALSAPKLKLWLWEWFPSVPALPRSLW